MLTIDLLLVTPVLQPAWGDRVEFEWNDRRVTVVGLAMNRPPDPNAPDMSPAALDRRLRELSQLYRLGCSLRDARLVGAQAQPADLDSLAARLAREYRPRSESAGSLIVRGPGRAAEISIEAGAWRISLLEQAAKPVDNPVLTLRVSTVDQAVDRIVEWLGDPGDQDAR